MSTKNLYIIGYNEKVYGLATDNSYMPWAPLRKHQVKRELKYFPDKAIIYKLVPVSPEDI